MRTGKSPVLSHQLNHLQNLLLLFGTTELQHVHDSAVHVVTVFVGLESVFTVKEAVNTAVEDIRDPDECGQGWMGTAMLDYGWGSRQADWRLLLV